MLKDSQIASICASEIRAASSLGGDLADERSTAMDYYLAEPYGDESKERSSIVTTEVRDTIQAILPSLMRIFRDADNLFTFDAVSEEDEDAAEQESDRVTYAYFKQNDAFFNTVSFCTDALLSKTGILKAWWDESPTEERAEYKNLNPVELSQLFEDEAVEREVVEFEQHEAGFDITFTEKRTNGKVRIEPVTPEDFGVNADARTPNAQDCDFVWHRVRKTKSQLMGDGYTEEEIRKIPKDDTGDITQENVARRHLSDEQEDQQRSEEMRIYWVTECYLHIDMREDNTPGMWKVTLATGSGNVNSPAGVLDKEEVDAHPFFTCTPVLLTHKFTGLSIADLVMDIQRIKSTILRNVLDNQYLANNRRHAISNRVNLDDMLTNRPGGVTRVDSGVGDISGDIVPIQSTPLAQETFGLMGYLDEMLKDRVGAGDEVAGLDTKSLANVNSSVAAIAYDQSRMKVEMIAELIAEIGFRPLFKRIHELLQKCQDKKEVMKLRNEWVDVNPSEWKTRENMTIMIGMGVSSRESRLVALEAIGQRQQAIVEGGGLNVLVNAEGLYNNAIDHADAMGAEGSRYFMNPAEAEPPQEEGPSVQDQAIMKTAEAQMGAAQAQNDRNKVDMAKNESAERIRVAELEQAEREIQGKTEIARISQELAMMKSQADSSDKQGKAMLDAEMKERDQELKAVELRMKDSQENSKREVDMYRAMMQSSTAVTTEQMKIAGSVGGGGYFADMQQQTHQVVQEAMAGLTQSFAGEMSAAMEGLTNQFTGEMGEIKARMLEQAETANAPKTIKRDAKGLIVSVGGKLVARDMSGRVESIG